MRVVTAPLVGCAGAFDCIAAVGLPFALTFTFRFALVFTCFFAGAFLRGEDGFGPALIPAAVRNSSETFGEKFLQSRQVGCGVHVSTEPEVHPPVITQDGAVHRHLAANRHVGIPALHLAPQQVERSIAAPVHWCTPG